MGTIQTILSKSPPEILYHYTSQDGLLGIVKTRTIWASKIQYLSDSQEFALALDLARVALNEHQSAGSSSSESELITRMIADIERKEMVNICVCSFSEEGDMLSQWRGYCSPGPGFALGFKSKTLQSLAGRQNFFLVPCVYNWSTQYQIVQELIDETTNAFNLQEFKSIEKASWSFVTRLATYAPVIKHHSFCEEKEWRLISNPIRSDDPKFGCRGGRSMMIPYYTFDLVGSDGQFEIAEVMIGPGPHQALNMRGVLQLLRSHGVISGGATRSQVPYRNW